MDLHVYDDGAGMGRSRGVVDEHGSGERQLGVGGVGVVEPIHR